jgi:hypothetical protein
LAGEEYPVVLFDGMAQKRHWIGRASDHMETAGPRSIGLAFYRLAILSCPDDAAPFTASNRTVRPLGLHGGHVVRLGCRRLHGFDPVATRKLYVV